MHRVAIVVIGVILCIMFSGGEKKSDAPKVTDLGITIKDFQTNFNKNARARNVPQMQLNNLEFGTDDKSNMFWNKFFSDRFALFGTINLDTNKIERANVLMKLSLSGEDRKAEAKAASLAFLIMVQTLSPSLNSEERAAILNKFSASSKPSVAVDIGDIQYSQVLLESGNVLMLSADVKD